MPVSARVSGVWESITQMSVRVSGTWRSVSQAYVRVAGVWQSLLGWSLNLLSYSGDTLDASGTLTGSTRSVAVSPDGLNFFLTDTHEVYHFSTPTQWDVASLTFDSKTNFSFASGTSSQCAKLSPDGTKLFVMVRFSSGSPDAQLRRYPLSTAWDLSTVGAQNQVCFLADSQVFSSFTFSGDGTELYLIDGVERIHRYSLVGAYSISSPTYDGVIADISSEVPSAFDFAFHPEGTSMFVSNDRTTAAAEIVELALSTPFDPSTGTLTGEVLDTSAECSPRGLAFNAEGTICVAFGDEVFPATGDARLPKYTLG